MDIISRIRKLSEAETRALLEQDEEFIKEYAKLRKAILNDNSMKASSDAVYQVIAVYCNIHNGEAQKILPEFAEAMKDAQESQKAMARDVGKDNGDLKPKSTGDIVLDLANKTVLQIRSMKDDGKKQSGENDQVKSVMGMETTSKDRTMGKGNGKEEAGAPDKETSLQYMHVYSVMNEPAKDTGTIAKAMEVNIKRG